MVERIGHRGAAGYEPESTKSSFEKALQLKVDCIEFDVHAVRKHWYSPRRNTLVVIHDEILDRTTDGTGPVGKKSLRKLKKLDAGKGQKILTDEEVLDIINKKTRVNFEAKGKRTARLISQTINKYINNGWSSDDFLVSSFDHEQLIKFKKLQPDVKIGALTENPKVENAQFAEDLGAYFVGIDKDIVKQSFVDDAHKRGVKVYVFTVNEPADIEKIKKLGVDGIFSDFPDRI